MVWAVLYALVKNRNVSVSDLGVRVRVVVDLLLLEEIRTAGSGGGSLELSFGEEGQDDWLT